MTGVCVVDDNRARHLFQNLDDRFDHCLRIVAGSGDRDTEGRSRTCPLGADRPSTTERAPAYALSRDAGSVCRSCAAPRTRFVRSGRRALSEQGMEEGEHGSAPQVLAPSSGGCRCGRPRSGPRLPGYGTPGRRCTSPSRFADSTGPPAARCQHTERRLLGHRLGRGGRRVEGRPDPSHEPGDRCNRHCAIEPRRSFHVEAARSTGRDR